MDTNTLDRPLNNQLEEQLSDFNSNISNRMDRAKSMVKDWGNKTSQKTKQAATAVDKCAHDHPWSGMLVGMASGALLGYLLMRKFW